MNEESQKQLNEFLQRMLKAGDFVLDQAPLVIQDVVAYGRAANTLYVVMGLIFLATAYPWWRYFTGMARKALTVAGRELALGYSIAAPVLSCVAGVSLIWVYINSFMLAWFAPRVYALEYLARLVK